MSVRSNEDKKIILGTCHAGTAGGHFGSAWLYREDMHQIVFAVEDIHEYMRKLS